MGPPQRTQLRASLGLLELIRSRTGVGPVLPMVGSRCCCGTHLGSSSPPWTAAGSGRVCLRESAWRSRPRALAGALTESSALRISCSRAGGLYCVRAVAFHRPFSESPGLGSSAQGEPFLTNVPQDLD